MAIPLTLLLATMALREIGAQPYTCDTRCAERGNCNPDSGECICQYGWLGKACEQDLLSACRIQPLGKALCGATATKNCACWQQCREYHSTLGRPADVELPGEDRGCFMRESVAAEQQNSRTPEEGEPGVLWYRSWLNLTQPLAAPSSEELQIIMRHSDRETLPLSQCADSCSNNGYCLKWYKQENAQANCVCLRGFKGTSCEIEVNRCLLKCSGRGKCYDEFCHCEPPYFGLGCTRSKSYPANHSMPSPVNFKIYMYELPTQRAYRVVSHIGGGRDDGIYKAYEHFLTQFLTSTVRTEDPSEANLKFIPALQQSYGVGPHHMFLLMDYVVSNYPWWNRTGGKDHFFWITEDRGGCYSQEHAEAAIKLVHWGMYENLDWADIKRMGKPHGCYHPLRDVMTPPDDPRNKVWANRSLALSVDDILKEKTRILSFAGGVLPGVKTYSGQSRQTLAELVEEWKDPDFIVFDHNVLGAQMPDYETLHRQSKFCLAPYGWGWGIRVTHAIAGNCVPLVVQEHVFQPFEELLPYETFSVRLTNADLPRVREILKGITEKEYRGMVEALLRYQGAFHWYPETGGTAFQYTILSLKRRYMNLKSMHY